VKIDYDQGADSLYLTLAHGEAEHTVEVEHGRVLVDLDGAEGVVGIEIYHVSDPWPLDAILDRFPLPDPAAARLRSLYDDVRRRGVEAFDETAEPSG